MEMFVTGVLLIKKGLNLWELVDGQESLVCCSPWGLKESDMTEWTEMKFKTKIIIKINYFNYSILNYFFSYTVL